jgi:large subunit ribosomal protein L15e
VNQDGVYKYFEVILVDPNHKAVSVPFPSNFASRHPLMRLLQIRRDARINWITKPVHKRREARGLTSIGKKVKKSDFDVGFANLISFAIRIAG